jgi:NADH pyrophosphatase NudC (nudix superfamily)
MIQAVVGLIFKGNKILLGKSTQPDFRLGKYCFVAGSCEEGENIYDTITREAKEEAGLVVKPRIGFAFRTKKRPHIAYVVCDYISGEINFNHEFENMNWYNLDNIPSDTLKSNKQLIDLILKSQSKR